MSSLRTIILSIALAVMGAAAFGSDAPTALARVAPQDSSIEAGDDGVEVRVTLSQAVPWRVFTLDDPRRLVLDFSEVEWPESVFSDMPAGFEERTGQFAPGWSRMVIGLPQPLAVEAADMMTGAETGTARLGIRLVEVSAEAFASGARAQQITRIARVTAPIRGPVPRPRPRRMRVAVDAGHGGIDSGARVEGLREKDLMLTFARELREDLLRGGFDVVMIRDSDVFIPLEERITIARTQSADAFLSLHADSLAEGDGDASGATVYALSDDASDLASQKIAERHDLADQLSGVDLQGQSDEIALVLMDIARTETDPRSDLLADALVAGLRANVGRVNSRPRREAAFSVLKAPDIPSVLIELGFLSSKRDRENIVDAEWREKAAAGIVSALKTWQEEDRVRVGLLRK